VAETVSATRGESRVAFDSQGDGAGRCDRLGGCRLRWQRSPYQLAVDELDFDHARPRAAGRPGLQAKCANCHNARLAAQVTRDFPNVDDEITVVTNGRSSALETMPSFGGVLTPAQIRDVVEYTRTQLGK
jgi:mono/diheme cytochrome c family protein